MRLVLLIFPVCTVIVSLVAGCAYSSPQQQEANACRIIGPKAMIGALAGAGGGAAIGAAAGGGRGAAIGAGIGLLAGIVAGVVADRQDCNAAQIALRDQILQARTNNTIQWSSPSGHSGTYQVTGDVYSDTAGAQCRRASSLPATPDDTAKQVIVCRDPNGNYSYANG